MVDQIDVPEEISDNNLTPAPVPQNEIGGGKHERDAGDKFICEVDTVKWMCVVLFLKGERYL